MLQNQSSTLALTYVMLNLITYYLADMLMLCSIVLLYVMFCLDDVMLQMLCGVTVMLLVIFCCHVNVMYCHVALLCQVNGMLHCITVM